MSTLFDAPAEPRRPYWMAHGQDLEAPRNERTDYLTCLRTDICPRCCEDLGGEYCHCDWAAVAAVGQAGTPEVHIDMRGANQ